MRIEAITRRKIVVELNQEDMNTLDITYDALDYTSVETRRVIWVILDRVRETTGCDIDPSGQLLIDAMPRPTGGCILFFTLRGGCAEPIATSGGMTASGGLATSGGMTDRILRKQEQLMAAFEFADIDALLDCAAAYAKSLRCESARLFTLCELYILDDRYRLLLCPALELCAVKRFFSEYAVFCGEDAFAACHTREHWKRAGGTFDFERLGGQSIALPCPRALPHFQAGNVYTSC